MSPDSFDELVTLIRPAWSRPRPPSDPNGLSYPRIHSCEAMLFSTLVTLTQGLPLCVTEALVGVSKSLIQKDFSRILGFLDAVLPAFSWTPQDRAACKGFVRCHPDVVCIMDGCDFPLAIERDAWISNVCRVPDIAETVSTSEHI